MRQPRSHAQHDARAALRDRHALRLGDRYGAAVHLGGDQRSRERRAEDDAAGRDLDGAVVFRVAGEREQVTYVPPSYGPGFWGYYGHARVAYDPGYYRSDQVVRVETSIYSIREDKLLWVGTTDTVNPDSVAGLVKDVAKAVRKELEREGAVPASR